MTSYSFRSPFNIGDWVIIDGDPDMRAVVIGLQFHAAGHDVRCAWMHGGSSYADLFDAFRLTLANPLPGETK